MNKLFILLLCIFGIISLTAQSQYHPENYLKTIPEITASTPTWAKKMYSSNPNVYEIDELYIDFYKINPFEKTTHTQNYKHWRPKIDQFVNINGNIVLPTKAKIDDKVRWAKNKRNTGVRTANWTNIGPFETYQHGTTTPRSIQSNVYSMDQSELYPDFLVAGTESGGVFKSSDRGLNWSPIGWNYELSGGHTAIQIHPTDTNNILVRANSDIYQSTDGGTTWVSILYLGSGKAAYEIKFHPTQADTIFVVGSAGLHRTYDGGTTWTQIYTDNCFDITFHTSSADTVYLLKENANAVRTEFFRSDDGGITWTLKDNGWYTPSDPNNAMVRGGKIGISAADPNIVYVGLIDEGKSGDNGWIGVYRSFNKGDNWTNPQGQDGSPYQATNTNPWNVAAYNNGYHQGFYNFDMIVSDINPGKILVGTVRLSESTDFAQSFTLTHYGHADIQDMEKLGSEVWIASDGGIDYAADDYASAATRESRKRGIIGSNFWGFGAGWNYDILFGGKYHNGNSLYYQTYSVGDYHHINGVEEATGYVHPMDKKVYNGYSNGVEVRGVPENFGDNSASYPTLALKPNESYWESNSSNLIFDNRYANWMYMGNENKFWKSTNNGATFVALSNFGIDSRVLETVQSRSNPNVFYAVVKPSGTSARRIYRTINGGNSWLMCANVPTNNRNKLEITINPSDENELWVVCNDGSNGNDVFKTTNGGTSWTNMSSATINDEHFVDIYYQGGTNDVVYIVGRNTMFYYDINASDWQPFDNGFSLDIKPQQLKPFYRDGKLRLATNGRGIWETPLEEQNFTPIAQPITHADSVFCSRDTVQFDCFSILNHSGATWKWTFSPAPLYVSSVNIRNPKVVFGGNGNYTVTLEVTDGNGNTDTKTINDMVTVDNRCNVDTLPITALNLTASGDYAQTPSFDETVTHFTMTAWIKPNGIQSDFSGIVMNDVNAAGLNFRGGNNTLGYHWAGGAWWWDSGLIPPSDEWSHVALVATPTSLTIYLNGVAATHNINLSPVDLNGMKIGSYKGWASRNYRGEIDEVAIWKRALTMDEIRLMRHLTKDKIIDSDADLMAYYQFNESSSIILDKTNNLNHAVFSGNADLVTSTAPIGSGTSEKQLIQQAGQYDFADVGLEMTIPMGVNPNGEVVVSRIHHAPIDSLPNTNHHLGDYWIINNYGSNQSFSALTELKLSTRDNAIPPFFNYPGDITLFQRDENQHLKQWSELCRAATVNQGTDNYFTFTDSCDLMSFGQLHLMAENFPVSTNKVEGNHQNKIAIYPNPASTNTILNIDLGHANQGRLRIYQVNGKLAKDFILNKNKDEVSLEGLNSGVYFYSVQTENLIYSGRLVIME